MEKRRNPLAAALTALLIPALAAAAVLLLLAAVSNLQAGNSAEGKKQLEETIRRDVITCYAAEGVYPPSVEYLEKHYGLQIDKSRYTVEYSVFADNLMPDVTVLDAGS
jgi:hypothetical protein